MKLYNQCIIIAVLTTIAYSGCNEWQELKSIKNYQDACQNSFGVYSENRCYCSNYINSIDDIQKECPNGSCEAKCDEGVICITNENKVKSCAGRIAGDLKKICESSGGTYNDIDKRCYCNPFKNCGSNNICNYETSDTNSVACTSYNEDDLKEQCQANFGIYDDAHGSCLCPIDPKVQPCDDGVVCALNNDILSCAGSTGDSFEKMCLSSGGVYNKTENNCMCDGNQCADGVVCTKTQDDRFACAGHSIKCVIGRTMCLNNNIYICEDSLWVKDRTCPTECDNYICKNECDDVGSVYCGKENDNQNNRYQCIAREITDRNGNIVLNNELKLLETCENGCFEAKSGNGCSAAYIDEREKALAQYLLSIAGIDKIYCSAMKCDLDAENKMVDKLNICNEKYLQCIITDCTDILSGCGYDKNHSLNCLLPTITDPSIKECCTQDKIDAFANCYSNSKHCDDDKDKCENAIRDIYNTRNDCVKNSCPSLSENAISILLALMNSLYPNYDITDGCINALGNCLINNKSVEEMKKCITNDNACQYKDATSKANECIQQELICMESCRQKEHTDICSSLCYDDVSCITSCTEITYCQSLCKQSTVSCLEKYEDWIIEKTVPIINYLLKLSISEGENENLHRELTFNQCSAKEDMNCSCTLLDTKCLANKDYCLKESSSCYVYLNARQNAEKQYDLCNEGGYCKLCSQNQNDNDNLTCMYNKLDTNVGFQYLCSSDGLWKEETARFCIFTDNNVTSNVSCLFDSEKYDMNSHNECGECLNGDVQCVDVNGTGRLQKCINGLYEKIEDCNDVSCMYRGPVYNLSDEKNNPLNDADKEKELILNDRRNWTCGQCVNGDEKPLEMKVCSNYGVLGKKTFITKLMTGIDVCDNECVNKTKECMLNPCENGVDCSAIEKDAYTKISYDEYVRGAELPCKVSLAGLPGEIIVYSEQVTKMYEAINTNENLTEAGITGCEDKCEPLTEHESNQYTICAEDCMSKKNECENNHGSTCSNDYETCMAGEKQPDKTRKGGCSEFVQPCYLCKLEKARKACDDLYDKTFTEYAKTFDACRAAYQTHVSCLNHGIDFACLQNLKYIEGGCNNDIDLRDASGHWEGEGIDKFNEAPNKSSYTLHFPCVDGRWEIDPKLKGNNDH